MNSGLVTQLLVLAAQNGDSVQIPGDSSHWHFYVAIGTLSTAVSVLFGVIMKLQASHSAEIAKIHEDHRKAIEERSRRFSEEFKEKDQKLYDVSVKMTSVVEQFTAAIGGLTEQIKERRQ